MSTETTSNETSERRWRPLSATQRRVIGVLIEKAKTTPDSYPLTLNALTNGCNQKSNRSPLMKLSGEDVEQALEELRELGAAAEVQSGGRVFKYRHYMYEWLGVDKAELAVMAELLLRGEQTIGELRGRAARMEPIPDLNALRPILDALVEKQLVVPLTPPGRGQMVTHNLYLPEQLEAIRQKCAAGRPAHEASGSVGMSRRPPAVSHEQYEQLLEEVVQLRAEVERLRAELGHPT